MPVLDVRSISSPLDQHISGEIQIPGIGCITRALIVDHALPFEGALGTAKASGKTLLPGQPFNMVRFYIVQT